MHPKQRHGELRRIIKRVQYTDDVTHRTPFDNCRLLCLKKKWKTTGNPIFTVKAKQLLLQSV